MKTQTSWSDVQRTHYPKLTTSLTVDVAIIGGGLTGILSAYLLAKEGKKVAILEKDTVGGGVTELTTAFLTEVIDTDFGDLIKIYGEEKARLVITSHQEAINLIEEIINEHHIEVNFKRCSDYIYINNEKQFEELTQFYTAARTLGIAATISRTPLPAFNNYGYIEIKNQAKFNPLKFITQLTHILTDMGVEIYEHTEVTEIKEDPLTLETNNGNSVKASFIIAATYDPFKQPFGLFFKKGTYYSYIYELDIPKGYIKEGIYEDTENPYHYFRVDEVDDTKDGMLIGGEDRRFDVPISDEKCFQALKDYIDTTFTGMKYSITKRWSGPVLEPTDGLAYIGPHSNKNILYAFGFSGNGMTYAGIAALVCTHLIMGKVDALYPLYRADRLLDPKSLAYKARDYGGELIHGALKNIFKHE